MEGVLWLQRTDWTVPGKAGVEGHVLPWWWLGAPACSRRHDACVPGTTLPVLSDSESSANWVTGAGLVGVAQPGTGEPACIFRNGSSWWASCWKLEIGTMESAGVISLLPSITRWLLETYQLTPPGPQLGVSQVPDLLPHSTVR